ncbi:MAG: bifunctional phosphoribosylaminoimidazolecarboxamide formyltransferase/IMP cyclohydrolase [Nitrospirae bacterium]|nr:bifunctional phosphoribosylaminoimidazolecarboxamide formyltransferase/IMP cyclohydrolase [Nitrospirota bacterium]
MRKALLSVSDKTGLVEFARGLTSLGFHLLSTGGTARVLKETGIEVTDVGTYTGFPEMLDGRVKTLHPRIHAGILARRNHPDDLAALKRNDIPTIDLVAVNLYPFEEKVHGGHTPLDEAIEEIDIGGPTLVRAAAKNFEHVCVVIDPADYPAVLDRLKKNTLDREFRLALAGRVFSRTAAYDAAISNYFAERRAGTDLPETLTVQLKKIQHLRYGENPHQRGGSYRLLGHTSLGILDSRQLQGKELSYNNLVDAEVAALIVRQFPGCAAVVIKHNNPSGVGTHPASLKEAYVKARDTDPVSAFGGVAAFNTDLDPATAQEMTKTFTEVVVAPGYAPAALEALKTKKDLRILEWRSEHALSHVPLDVRTIGGGALVQDLDVEPDDPSHWKTVTKRPPSDKEVQALVFGWRVCRFVKSNAIVFTTTDRTLGVGAGQMSRVDSVKIAGTKMREFKLEGRPLAMGSDAFFPFRDGIDEAAKMGVTAIVQPGGSIRDSEVIAAADEHGMAMMFTGRRHFRH